VERAFVIVVAVVGIVGILGAVVALLVSRGTWESLGRDRLLMESDLHDPRASRSRPAPGGGAATPSDPAAVAERDEEIRQMLDARNRRRRRLGQAQLDVEAELRRLTRAPAARATQAGETLDPELLAEIRELVVARNHRRARRGEPQLDVETEIARQIARLNG
jgi:hypothetical protein